MKKNLLFSTFLSVVMLCGSATTEAANCACAGRCATGSTCNCSTGACSIPTNLAYGYVDTSMPVVYAQPMYPNYRTATPYRTDEPSRKYRSNQAKPYMAIRVGWNNMEGDLQYKSSYDGKYKKNFDDDAYSLALAFGARMDDHWRAELEASLYTKAEGDAHFRSGYYYKFNDMKAQVMAKTLLFNLYYDIPTQTRWTPFLGAGIGVSHLTGKLKGIDRDDCHNADEKHTNVDLAFQLGAGMSYALSGTVNLDFAYRYTHFGKAKIQKYDGPESIETEHGTQETRVKDSTNVKDLSAHSLSAGLRFNF